MDEPSAASRQWILLLSLTALLLSLVVLAHTASRYATAYLQAPGEVSAFLEALDSSISENETYNTDIAKLKRVDDKARLARILRDIQRGCDQLRDDLNSMLVGEVGSSHAHLRNGARMFWAGNRVGLEAKLRHLDLLRMRFLVVHMGFITSIASEVATRQQEAHESETERPYHPLAAQRPSAFSRALTDSIRAKPPLRRLTAPAPGTPGPPETVEGNHRRGWAGVVQELQRSPLLHKRHTSIEMSLTRTP
ncbi:hypothetical protein QBC39DRAFT_263834 [Podospora conica]|nr:hypothetical protein QBC39DRAFT_263834 [Schizothecium conicum]